MIEHRSFAVEMRGGIIVGLAAPFGKPSTDLGGFTETINSRAFNLKRDFDVCALHNHETRDVLGRTKSGTLRLQITSEGLAVEIDPPDTTLGRDTVTSIRRGDIRGMSFSFSTLDDDWHVDHKGDTHRELLDVILHEVSTTAFPAYLDTWVRFKGGKRSAYIAGQLYSTDTKRRRLVCESSSRSTNFNFFIYPLAGLS